MRLQWWLIIIFLWEGIVSATTLERINVYRQHENKVISLQFSNQFTYKTFMLHNPERFVLDCENVTTKLDVTKLIDARVGKPSPNMFRIVFDLSSPTKPHTALVARQELRITFPPSEVPQRKRNRNREIVVVIDPGHGGKDPGAIGFNRHAEKDIVLSMALKLKKRIDRERGMRAVLTRSGDYFVGLRERLNIARKHNADIFISIHADAFKNQQSTGASVFALSPNGATSEAARWLAEKENYSELGGVNLGDLDDRNGLLRTVLIDLSQTATIGSSLQMGSQVLQYLDKITRLHHHKVEQARFVVLKSPDIPSILVETGFISNPREELNLASKTYQERLIQALFAGVKRYFYEHPPLNT